MSSLEYNTELEIISCGECNILHAIPKNLHRQAKEYGRSWYCPNGHNISYTTTDLGKAQKQLKDLKEKYERDRRYWQAENGDLESDLYYAKMDMRTAKSRYTITINKIHAGKCPHCNKQQEDLIQHINEEHQELIKPPKTHA